MAFVLKGRSSARLGLVLLAIPLAVVANTIRITSLLWVIAALGDEIGLSFYHDWSSPLLFLLALGLLILASWVMGCREIRSDI
jgi:exosortase/archaeosortase family protein